MTTPKESAVLQQMKNKEQQKEEEKRQLNMTIEEQISQMGQQFSEQDAANVILTSMVGKKLIQRMKLVNDEKRNLLKKMDVMMKTSKMREKQLAVNIEGSLKESQKKMIDEFFAMMKIELKATCDQARAIRQESVLRDATEKKLVTLVMV